MAGPPRFHALRIPFLGKYTLSANYTFYLKVRKTANFIERSGTGIPTTGTDAGSISAEDRKKPIRIWRSIHKFVTATDIDSWKPLRSACLHGNPAYLSYTPGERKSFTTVLGAATAGAIPTVIQSDPAQAQWLGSR